MLNLNLISFARKKNYRLFVTTFILLIISSLNSYANILPTANAGNDRKVDPGIITLDGSGSMTAQGLVEGLTYQWEFVSGPQTPSITNNTSVLATVTLLNQGDYIFSLTVSDTQGSAVDLVTISINNITPIINIEPLSPVLQGDLIYLNASLSTDRNADTLTFSWSPIDYIDDPTSPTPSLTTTDLTGTYKLTLTVSDGSEEVTEDVYAVINTLTDTVPTADAGLDIIGSISNTYTLNGSFSADPEGSALTYLWEEVEGPEILSFDATSPTPEVTPTCQGIFKFSLVVTNENGISSPPDYIYMLINYIYNEAGQTTSNYIPRAVASADITQCNVGDTITLDGSESVDADGTDLTYSWNQIAGPNVPLSDYTSSTPTFIPTVEGNIIFELIVSDGLYYSLPAQVEITVIPAGKTTFPEAKPFINTTTYDPDGDGRINMAQNSTIVLEGMDSTGEGFVTYKWVQISGPICSIVLPINPVSYFSPVRAGVYKFRLYVYDINGVFAYKDLELIFESYDSILNPTGNLLAYSNAGVNASGTVNTTVELKSISSYDPIEDSDGIGNITAGLQYEWIQTAGPMTVLNDANTFNPSFIPLITGTYYFDLYVNDGINRSPVSSIFMIIIEDEVTVNPEDNGPSTTTETKTGSYGGGCFIKRLFSK